MANLNAHNIADLREAAKRRLPRGLFEYVDRGTENEVSIRGNRLSFDSVQFVPRPLVDVTGRSMKTTLFGKEYSLPIVIAPTGLAGMLWHEGEVAAARAAAQSGIPFTLSTASITSLEDVAAKAGGELWFQLYLWSKMEMSYELVKRARAAGYKTLMVTIDSVVNGNREHNRRNGFTIPMRLTPRNLIDGALHPRWTLGVMGRYLIGSGLPEFANFPEEIRTDLRGNSKRGGVMVPKNESQTWEHIRTLREMWPDGPLIVKGILHPRDARNAVMCGADGIVVSNHGARTLDGAVSPMQVVQAIAAEVNKQATILLDSSVMRGSDIVKALALGADAVMIGRATLWGIAAGGQPGAALALDILNSEIDRVMAYLGCRTIGEIDERIIYGMNDWERGTAAQTPSQSNRILETPK